MKRFTKVRFPKVDVDGSFAVRVYFTSFPGATVVEVRDWLAKWLAEHSEWFIFGATHAYSDYFSAPPEVEVGPASELCIVLRGRSDSKRFWKDWGARICVELRSQFRDAGKVARIENA